VKKYLEIDAALCSLETVVIFGPLYLNCAPLIHSLSAHCKALASRLLKRLTELHVARCRKICKGYENIRRKALKEPEDSKELIDLVAYLDKVKTYDLNDLKAGIKDSQRYLR
jgi:hypothetical protein